MSSSEDITRKQLVDEANMETDMMQDASKDIEVENDVGQIGERVIEDEMSAESSHPQPPTVDEENGVVTVAVEDLLAAGIDVENLSTITQDELAKVIAMAKRNSMMDLSVNEHPSKKVGPEGTVADVEVADTQTNACPQNAHNPQEDPWSLLVTDDGSIRLTDSQNHTYLFTQEVLQTHHIDANNLTEENIQSLLALAMPIPKLPAEEPLAKRPKLASSSVNNSYPMEDCGLLAGKRMQHYSLIGEEIAVRREGKLVPATFADGHFEWVRENDIILSVDKPSTSSASTRQYMHPSMDTRRKYSMQPGIRVTVPNQRYECHEAEANYCCQVCDRKVFQKEPTYIVVRIPACHSCAEKHIFILDENEAASNKEPEDDQDSRSEAHQEPPLTERRTNSAPLQEYAHSPMMAAVQPRSASIDWCKLSKDYRLESPEREKAISPGTLQPAPTVLPSANTDGPQCSNGGMTCE
uniref:Protein kinase domain-containing protein n=1 Tax=Steinernema glaseri TaxID=37863 RepID=A0A1I7Y514_9BILA